MIRPLLPLAALTLASAAAAQVGTPHCFGNGCPCGNDDPTAGCGNNGFDGDAATGATLTGLGSADVWFDDLVLEVGGLQPDEFGIVIMGDTVAPVPGGDGLRCVGAGPGGLWRFPVDQVNPSGIFRVRDVIAGSKDFGMTGWIEAGQTWQFQAWARDPGGRTRTSTTPWRCSMPSTWPRFSAALTRPSPGRSRTMTVNWSTLPSTTLGGMVRTATALPSAAAGATSSRKNVRTASCQVRRPGPRGAGAGFCPCTTTTAFSLPQQE